MQPPFITHDQQLPEITVKVLFLSVFLTIILAASNAYLALKIGMLTSASIPAAILSMGILRLFKQSNILENNLVQTCASTGEAVAGGMVYTIPALIIIHYWTQFNFLQTSLISFIGGILGVMFSVLIRRSLLNDPNLRFPEGRAIAAVLQLTAKKSLGLREMLIGSGLGAMIEFAQSGIKVIGNNIQSWFSFNGTVLGFGSGLSATLVGAGYLIGFEVGISILLGGIIGWGICIPVLSLHHSYTNTNLTDVVMDLWSTHIRYIGIGAMLIAGLWTLLTLLSSLIDNLKLSFKQLKKSRDVSYQKPLRTDQDIPVNYVLLGIAFCLIATWFLFHCNFPLVNLGIPTSTYAIFNAASLFYVLAMGFLICIICGFFSGMVGVSASPGSSAVIAGMLLAALLIRSVLVFYGVAEDSLHKLTAAAITIIIGAVITCAAAITNDNIQDLKVGQLVGSTPWKQQLMLIFGVIIGSLIIPPVMQTLFNVYGIGGVFPHANMDPTQQLPAPPAALMAAVTQAVFNHMMPWSSFLMGAYIGIGFIVLNLLLKKHGFKLSVIGVAVGIYLPLSSSTPLFIGATLSWLTKRKLQRSLDDPEHIDPHHQRGMLLACGLVAGAALMDVLLAIPFAIKGSPDALRLVPANFSFYANILGILTIASLCVYIYKSVTKMRV